MNTLLTDFSPLQLQLLLNAVENYRQDIKMERIPTRKFEDVEKDLTLLRVQLLTAVGIVARREQIAQS